MLTTLCSVAACLGITGAVEYGAPIGWRAINTYALRRKVCHKRQLSITYDDGPGEHLTPQLLEVLKAHSARATFFALGRRAVAAPEVMERILAEGHELGCHSSLHLHALKTLPPRSTIDALMGLGSLSRWLPPKPLFRPPYGKITLSTWILMRSRGCSVAWWTIDSGDTHPVLPKAQDIVDRVVREGGGVVLLHDFDRSLERGKYVLETTEHLLAAAKREGIHCDTWSDVTS